MPEEYGPLKLKVPLKKGDGAKAPQAFKDFADSIAKPPTGAKTQLAVVQESGAIAYKTVKGDANLEQDGTLTLAPTLKPVRWWTPSVVTASQSRSNTAFGVLGTPDRVSIVTAAHMMILIVVDARVQCSVAGAGRVAVFLGGKQIQFDAGAGRVAQEIAIEGAATNRHVYSHPGGLGAVTGAAYGGVSSNQPNVMGGPLGGGAIWLWAGENATHSFGAADVEIQYRATSGSITADERRLLVGTVG